MQHKLNQSLYQKHSKKGSHDGIWAISYADFLMVLLSFFILFFSMDQKSPYHKIAIDLKNLASGGKSVAQGNGTGSGSGNGAGSRQGEGEGTGSGVGTGAGGVSGVQTHADPKELLEKIALDVNQKVSVRKEIPYRIYLDLEPDVYPLGGYSPPKEQLEPILQKLKQYRSDISITVVGQTDLHAFSVNTKQSVLRDNLTLAGVRASYASSYIQKKLPDINVWAQASNLNQRNTRSLSLVIEPVKEDAGHE